MAPDLEPGFGDETLDAAISPDETAIVFVAAGDTGLPRLWRRRLDGERAEPMKGTEGAQFPVWKQSGGVVAFFARGQLKAVAAAGGHADDLADAPAPAGAAWQQDGSLVFAAAPGPLHRLREGRLSAATTLIGGDTAHVFPVAIAGTNDFVYTAVRHDGRRVIRLVSGAGGRDLSATTSHGALIGDRLLHARDGGLLAYLRDAETGAVSPRGVLLATGVGAAPSGRGLFVASPSVLLHAAPAPSRREIVWLDFAGARGESVADAGDYRQLRLAPDDRTVAVTVMDPLLRALDIAIVPASGGALMRQTRALAADSDPVWSPDGTRLLFRSMQSGRAGLYVRPIADPAANDVLMHPPAGELTPTGWSGHNVLIDAHAASGSDIVILDERTGTTRPVATTSFNETDARWSPDGRWIAYVSDESGAPDIYVRLPDGSRLRVSFAGGTRPRWTRDGRSVIFTRGSQLMRADLQPASPLRFGPPRPLFELPGLRDFDLAHRADRIIALVPVKTTPPAPINVIVNWRSLLDR